MNENISKFDLKAKILANIEIAESHFRMQFACSEIAATARPGQFIHLLIDQQRDPLLRRPFTIYRAKNGIIEIIFQVIGRGTRLLSQKRPGDEARVMGPLGNSFVIPDELDTAILIGGGIGIASLMMLAEELGLKGKRSLGLIGAQNCGRLLCVDDLQAVGTEIHISTDDGSCGYRGLVTDFLKQMLSNPQKYRLNDIYRTDDSQQTLRNLEIASQKPVKGLFIYACGPDGMLKSVAKIAEEFHLPAQLALENRMACGVGACLGCVLKIKSALSACDGGSRSNRAKPQAGDDGFEYKRVCLEGPIFDAQDIVWD